MYLKRITAYDASEKAEFKLDDKFNEQIATDLKEAVNKPYEIINYELDKDKTNKKKFHFENKNYSYQLNKILKDLKGFLPYLIGIIIVFVLIDFLQRNNYISKELGLIITVSVILVFVYKLFGSLMFIISYPKVLIISNGLMYEESGLKKRSHAFFFDEIVLSNTELKNYIYFKRKSSFNEKSLVFYSDIEDKTLESFFREYVKVAHNITFHERLK